MTTSRPIETVPLRYGLRAAYITFADLPSRPLREPERYEPSPHHRRSDRARLWNDVADTPTLQRAPTGLQQHRDTNQVGEDVE